MANSGITDVSGFYKIEGVNYGSEQVMGTVLEPLQVMMAELTATADALQASNDSVRADMDMLYTGFQFQDRVTQMLSQVTSSMAELSDLLTAEAAGELPHIDLDEWGEKMKNSYSMEEQRAAHDQRKADSDQSTIEFF